MSQTAAMTRAQRRVLAVAILASFVAFLDGSVVNVALPAISAELGGGLATQQWVVDAYLITLGALILVAGSLADQFGRVRVIRLGLIGFGLTSALCAVVPSADLLVLARAAQGAAGALLVPSSLALIMGSMRGALQSRAIGSWTAWTSAAFIAGPLLGGVLVDLGSWRWVFAINILPIAATLWLLHAVAETHEPDPAARVDLPSAACAALGVGGVVFALIEQQNLGLDSPLIWGSAALGAVALTVFLLRQRGRSNAILPLTLFGIRNFAWGNAATVAIYAALSLSTFLIVVYLQQAAGFPATLAGLAALPVTAVMMLLSGVIGRLSGRFGPRWFMTAGPIIAAIGHLLLLSVTAELDYWSSMLPGVLVFGLGLAITVAPLTSAILGAVPQRLSGTGSAVNNAIARIAGLVAIAFIGVIVAGTLDDEGFRRGMIVAATLLALGGILSAIGIRNPGEEEDPGQTPG